MVKTAIIIPARFASSRFPGKPLADIQGKTMIQRVIEQCLKVKNTPFVLVATDDQRILDHVVSLGYRAVLTHSNHPSGTDRCYEA
ncbi:MAG: cytidylyltransferase domain-containing protein, partial [Flavobacteriales bacterium]